MTAPATPLATPAPIRPSVSSDRRFARSGGPDSPAPPASPLSPAPPVVANRSEISSRRVPMPHKAPTTVGMTSTAEPCARLSTAAHPTTPAIAIIALPIGRRLRSTRPATAASSAITTRMATDRTSLFAVPNSCIAHSLTGPGVSSMNADPTAVRTSASGPNAAPSSCATPTATAAAAMPPAARGPSSLMSPSYRRDVPESLTELCHPLGCFTVRPQFGKSR